MVGNLVNDLSLSISMYNKLKGSVSDNKNDCKINVNLLLNRSADLNNEEGKNVSAQSNISQINSNENLVLQFNNAFSGNCDGACMGYMSIIGSKVKLMTVYN